MAFDAQQSLPSGPPEGEFWCFSEGLTCHSDAAAHDRLKDS